MRKTPLFSLSFCLLEKFSILHSGKQFHEILFREIYNQNPKQKKSPRQARKLFLCQKNPPDNLRRFSALTLHLLLNIPADKFFRPFLFPRLIFLKVHSRTKPRRRASPLNQRMIFCQIFLLREVLSVRPELQEFLIEA